jgi:hypothetical protein
MTQSDRDRIAGREWAEAVLDDLADHTADFLVGFRRRMLAEYRAAEVDRTAMSDDAARRFGDQIITFGVHQGQRYDDVPLEYLEWLADQNAALVRYVRSRRVKAEQEDEQ